MVPLPQETVDREVKLVLIVVLVFFSAGHVVADDATSGVTVSTTVLADHYCW